MGNRKLIWLSAALAVAGANTAVLGYEPPPPPARFCMSGPFLFFFDRKSAEVKDYALHVANDLVKYWPDCKDHSVRITGHTDHSEGNDMKLSLKRANAVAKVLDAKGIPASLIKTYGKGNTEPRIMTNRGVAEVQNRNVYVSFVPNMAAP